MISPYDVERALLNEILLENADIDNSLFMSLADELNCLDLENYTGSFVLSSFALKIRSLFLSCAEKRCRNIPLSPINSQAIQFRENEKMHYGYARNISSELLEKKIDSQFYAYYSDTVLFNSGMSAIDNTLRLLIHYFSNFKNDPIRIGVFAGYFETKMIFRLLTTNNVIFRFCDTEDELLSEKFDIVYLEPILYNWDLSSINLQKIFSSWFSDNSPRVLIVDSSLTPESWNKKHILKELIKTNVDILCDVRSGVKIDQLGFELCNVGIVRIYQRHKVFDHFSDNLRKMRSLTGSCLQPRDLIILYNSFFLNDKWLNIHNSLICKNNAILASFLMPFSKTGLLDSISHPSVLSDTYLNHAPFVILRLNISDFYDYNFFVSVLAFESQRRNLNFNYRNSFGFRDHNYDIIIPSVKERSCIFKIAMGSRQDQIDEICNMLLDLLKYASIKELKKDYPSIKKIKLIL